MDDRLLEILCCPTTKAPVRRLTAEELAALNRALAEGTVVNAAGNTVTQVIRAGLVTRDGRTIYRLDDDIPVMLAEEAISADRLPGFPGR